MAQLKAMDPSTAEKIGGPAVTAGKMALNYGKTLFGEGKKAIGEIQEAGENIDKGGPMLANWGKAYAAGADFLLKGVLSPVGGGAISAWGEDVHSGNYTGAAGSALAVLINGLLLKGSLKPKEGVRVNKLAFASDLPDTMDAGKQLRAVMPDLDRAAGKTGPPKTVGELLTTVKEAKNQMNTESGLAMRTLRGKEFVPTGIADSIKARITPDMIMTPEGRQMQSALLKAAKDYEKPWTYEQLDQARMRAGRRLRSLLQEGIDWAVRGCENRRVSDRGQRDRQWGTGHRVPSNGQSSGEAEWLFRQPQAPSRYADPNGRVRAGASECTGNAHSKDSRGSITGRERLRVPKSYWRSGRECSQDPEHFL